MLEQEEKAYYLQIGSKVKKILVKQKLAQYKLAEGLGIHRASLTHWLKGDRAISTYSLHKIAEVMDVSMVSLLPDGDHITETIDSLQQENAELKEENGILKDQNTDLQAENAKLLSKLDTASAESATLKKIADLLM